MCPWCCLFYFCLEILSVIAVVGTSMFRHVSRRYALVLNAKDLLQYRMPRVLMWTDPCLDHNVGRYVCLRWQGQPCVPRSIRDHPASCQKVTLHCVD